MPKVATRLNDTQIKRAKASDKNYELSDGEGLILRVLTSGTKSWIFRYSPPYTKKRTNISFGTYPLITLKEARQLREEARTLLAKNIDPKEHKKQAEAFEISEAQNTFRLVAQKWFEIKKTTVTEGYAEDLWSSLENHLFPRLGDRAIRDLTAPLVIEVMQPLAARGVYEQIRRLCQRVNEIMTYAVNTGIIHANPLAGIKSAFQSPKRNHMNTIEPERLPELLERLNRASIKYTTRCLIEWQLHTLCRPSEAACAKWSEIDFENEIWTIPAERMKARKEHKIPLTKQSLHLLELMKPISAHLEYIFPADRNPRTHTNPQTANAALKRMGFQNILVAHGLRALGSTILNERGFDPDLIESALAHTDKNEVRRAYNRAQYLARRREMMEWWSEHLMDCI